jgi:hypothetical protein
MPSKSFDLDPMFPDAMVKFYRAGLIMNFIMA